MSVDTLAVLGAGDKGIGVALLGALAGLHVRLWDPSEDVLRGAILLVRQQLERAVRDGAPPAHRQTILDGVLATIDLEEAVIGAGVVLETGPEAPDIRAEVLARAAVAEPGATLLVSGRLEEVAARLQDPSRLAGLLLGDRIRAPRAMGGSATSSAALEAARAIAAALAGAAAIHPG